MSAGQGYQAAFGVTRGGQIESVHWAAIAIADTEGKLLASLGDAEQHIFPRSSIKPFQAMPLIEAGGAEHFGLNEQEIALICSSHSGTEKHADSASKLLAKIGAEEGDLLCGTHAPYHRESAQKLLRNGEKAGPLQHNCSGKHAGMLALAKLKGWEIGGYTQLDHPVQLATKASLAEWADFPEEELAVGVDGCSAANFALPLRKSAQAFARLMEPHGLPPAKASAAERIREAMLSHPDYVGGPERFDTKLMEVTRGRILSKAGAEGFQAMAIPAGKAEIAQSAIGIALKIADGDARNMARAAVSLALLDQIGALSEAELAELQAFGPMKNLLNQAGIEVGQGRPIFTIKQNEK